MRRRYAAHGGQTLSPGLREQTLGLFRQKADQDSLFGYWGQAARTLAAQYPKDVAQLFIFPYPWERWPVSDRWSFGNLAASGQSVLWYLLLPGIALGVWRSLRRSPIAGMTLLFWGMGVGLFLALVVLNRGTLFRLREMAFLPLMLFLIRPCTHGYSGI